MNAEQSPDFLRQHIPLDNPYWEALGYRSDPEGAASLNAKMIDGESFIAGAIPTDPPIGDDRIAFSPNDHELSWREKLNLAVRPVAEDIRDSKSPIATTVLGLGALATQGANFLRISVVVVPEVASQVLERTHSPLWTAIAAGSANFLISAPIGELAIQGLAKYTRTVDSLSSKFPKLAGFLQSNLPGFKPPKSYENEGKVAKFSRGVLRGSIKHIKRAINGMSISSGMYALTAKTMGYTKAEARKVNYGLGLDTSVLVGGIAWKLGDYINNLAAEGNYDKVKTIESWVGNTKNWWALAGGLMVMGAISSKIERRKLKKEQAKAVSLRPDIV